MQKSILRYFIIVLVISLLSTSILSATLISDYLLDVKKQDMFYTIRLMSYALNDTDDMNEQIQKLNPFTYDDDSRITIINTQGYVLADTYKETGLENHIDRQEIKDALKQQVGYATRKSETTGENMLYAAYYNNRFIIRLSLPYNGIFDQLPILIPAFSMSALFSFVIAYILARKLSQGISKPIIEISESLDHMSDDFRFDLKTYDYNEFNTIVDTIHNLSHKLRKSMREVKLERYKIDEILKQMNEGFVLLDEKSRILSMNEKAMTLLGKMNLYDSILDYLYYPEIIQALENNISKQEIQLKINQSIYACYISRINIGVTLLFVDITAIKKAEKMRSEFFSNVSHELKTPMTSIYGYSDLLAQGLVVDEEKKQVMLNKIRDEVSQMSTLINDILTLSRLENMDVKEEMLPMKIQPIVEDVLESYEVEIAQHDLKINKHIEDMSYIGNHRHIYTLLNNIIGNAIKYNQEGGSVDIDVCKQGEAMKICVKDTGIGIPLSDQARVFERFYRVDKGRSKQRGGTGLGLAIVKHIVSYYKGTIQLTSEISKGTQIEIILPEQTLTTNK